MSIVDGSRSGYNPIFNYKSRTNTTPIHGWLCTDTHKTCNPPNCPNNTSAQGKLFYDAVSSAEGGGENYSLLEVTGTISCTNAEGVDYGIDPDYGGYEYVQIQTHMTNNCLSQP